MNAHNTHRFTKKHAMPCKKSCCTCMYAVERVFSVPKLLLLLLS